MSKRRDPDHGDREARYRIACERLDMDDPHCFLSDERSPFAIELHHVAGHAYHPENIPISKNHHARASDYAKDHPPKIPGCTSPLEGWGHLLLGLGDLALIGAEDAHDPIISNFLMYLHGWLKTLGMLLIERARGGPLSKS